MKYGNSKWLKRILAIGAGIVLGATGLAPAAQAEPVNPQQPGGSAAAEVCVIFANSNAVSRTGISTFDEPRTYNSTGWTTATCGEATVAVPRGQRALLDAVGNAELDCNGGVNTWCEGRIAMFGVGLYSTVMLPVAPDNSSFAFDSANGGTFNWQAHSMHRANVATCPPKTNPNDADFCYYTAYLQVKQGGGGTSGISLWLDDLYLKLTATYGLTTVRSDPTS